MPIEHQPRRSSLTGCSDAIFDAIETRYRDGKYRSPFQTIKDRFPQTRFEDMFPCMQYEGTLRAVINELEAALKEPVEYPNFYRIAMHPPLLTRAAIDWKIDHPEEDGSKYVKAAIDIALAVYGRRPDARSNLDQFYAQVSNYAPSMLDIVVAQNADAPTWHGTNPDKSYCTARELAFTLEGQNILLIPLGHGGTAAGVDVFLRYVDITQGTDSNLYVARFSRRKKGDEQPRLSPDEIRYLQEIGTGNQIVVFEEDSATHRTLESGHSYFQFSVFPGESVSSCCNLRI